MEVKITNQPLQLTKKTSFAGSVFEAGFLIVLILIGYFYLVAPKHTNFSELKDMKESLQSQKEDLSRKEQVFANLLQELNNESDGVKLADEMLPTENRPSRIYILMENIAQKASLPSAVISVDSTPQLIGATRVVSEQASVGEDYSLAKNVISFSAAGTVDQMDNLIKLLETSSRFIQVKSLEVNQGSNDQLLFKVSAETYSYIPAQKTE